jgi:hypothetical protein
MLRASTPLKSNPQESALWIFTLGSVGGSNEIILSRQPRDYENTLSESSGGAMQCYHDRKSDKQAPGKSRPGLHGERLRVAHLTPESFHAAHIQPWRGQLFDIHIV